eukprot:5323247-Pleurochrysis_carterae.AAC.1
MRLRRSGRAHKNYVNGCLGQVRVNMEKLITEIAFKPINNSSRRHSDAPMATTTHTCGGGSRDSVCMEGQGASRS